MINFFHFLFILVLFKYIMLYDLLLPKEEIFNDFLQKNFYSIIFINFD